jgi:uncharacterized membrane protein YedE/YeeE
MRKLSSLISGIIFGLGLTISSMTNPEKVLDFLNIFGDWDPSLIFVMFGAILISSPAFYFQKEKTKPLFDEKFYITSLKEVDKSIIIGASLFGVGWGLVGLCPGPAIAALSLINMNSIIFVISMVGSYGLLQFFKAV